MPSDDNSQKNLAPAVSPSFCFFCKLSTAIAATLIGLTVILAANDFYKGSIYVYSSTAKMEKLSSPVPVELRPHGRSPWGLRYAAFRTDGQGQYEVPAYAIVGPAVYGSMEEPLRSLTGRPITAYVSERSWWHGGGKLVSLYTEDGHRVIEAKPYFELSNSTWLSVAFVVIAVSIACVCWVGRNPKKTTFPAVWALLIVLLTPASILHSCITKPGYEPISLPALALLEKKAVAKSAGVWRSAGYSQNGPRSPQTFFIVEDAAYRTFREGFVNKDQLSLPGLSLTAYIIDDKLISIYHDNLLVYKQHPDSN